ncbi:MAG: protein-disulfide reductase DsbD family protein [Abditibacteriales bacterium]|nr:protein-disulfide reductase DsbD family protein [Abditibacteriales bacterium]MDW8366839.1 cytochrome c biogenesis protein CcdA [Abditibacteriales bacterium]
MTKSVWVGNMLFILTLWGAVSGWAGGEEKVKVKTLASVDKVRQGSTFHVAVILDISPGWHTYDNNTPKPYIATEWKLTPPKGLTLKGKVAYPKGVVKNLPGAGGAVSVYEGKVVIGATLTAAKDAPLGKQTIKTTLRYQVCSDTVCLPPVRGKPLDVVVEVVKPNAPTKDINKDVFSKPPFKSAWAAPSAPTIATVAPTPLLLAGGGILEALTRKAEEIGRFVNAELGKGRLSLPLVFLLLVGGVLSAFSPCVIPVIPMTIAFFGNQARIGGGKAKALALALCYVAGIATLYSTIGVIAVIAGKSLSFILQGPSLWLLIVLLFGAMGLSMVGLFEIPVPAFMSSVAGARTGFVGAFVMGLVASILFLPCAGPVVGGVATGLIALAQTEASTLTMMKTSVIAFLYYSVGLGTPFLVLALLSGSALRAPRSGDWTLAVKRLFGLVFLGMALYFMQYVPHGLLMATFLVGCGIYLAFFEQRLGVRPIGKCARVAAAAAVTFLGVFLGAHAKPERAQPAPTPHSRAAHHRPEYHHAKPERAQPAPTQIAWQPYSDTLLRQAAQQGKPVIINFTADW